MSEWYDFLDTGDAFFISYSMPGPLIPVKLFELGHTIELYLKGAFIQQTGDIKRAIGFHHDIKGVWDACKSLDKNFLPKYEIKNSVYNCNYIAIHKLTPTDQIHYYNNRELYIIAKHLPDIKYLGTPLKTIKDGALAWFLEENNPYWIAFLKELRQYLGYPIPRYRDQIYDCITEKNIPPSSIKYLMGLYS